MAVACGLLMNDEIDNSSVPDCQPPPRCLISGPLTESGHSTHGLVGIPAKKIEIKVT
jgi:hypothetical protein